MDWPPADRGAIIWIGWKQSGAGTASGRSWTWALSNTPLGRARRVWPSAGCNADSQYKCISMYHPRSAFSVLLLPQSGFDTMPHEQYSIKGSAPKVSKGRPESPLVAPTGAKPLPSTKQSFSVRTVCKGLSYRLNSCESHAYRGAYCSMKAGDLRASKAF